MATTETTADSWTFPLNLQGDNSVPDAELIKTATQSLEKISGFVKVYEDADGTYMAQFNASGESREKIQTAIQASGFASRQTSHEGERNVTALPTN